MSEQHQPGHHITGHHVQVPEELGEQLGHLRERVLRGKKIQDYYWKVSHVIYIIYYIYYPRVDISKT